MGHPWRIVKNSERNEHGGGHRPREEFLQDVDAALHDFAENEPEGFAFHESVREALGLTAGEQVVDHQSLFVNPFPYLQSHGSYFCGMIAMPTSVADGKPEFTSLFIIATQRQLLTVILDPHTSYSGPFGQRLVNRHAFHRESENGDVGATLLMIIRDNVTALNFALRELSLDVGYYSETLRTFNTKRRADQTFVLGLIESYLLKLRAEIASLETVVVETARILDAISESAFLKPGPAGVFDTRHEIAAANLAMQSDRTVSIRQRLDTEVGALLDKCEQQRDKFLVDLTNKFGVFAGVLLFPSLILDFYGQNVRFPDHRLLFSFWFSSSVALLSMLSFGLFVVWRRWLRASRPAARSRRDGKGRVAAGG